MAEQVTRFRRESYAGGNSSNDEPRWHIPTHELTGTSFYGQYKSVTALCGYTIKWPGVWMPTRLSRAVKPRGQHCTKCIEIREKSNA
jgi:hypothetical protein